MSAVEVLLCYYPPVKPWRDNSFVSFTMLETLNKIHKSEVTWCDGKSKSDRRKPEVSILFSSFYLGESLVSLSVSFLIYTIGLIKFVKTTKKLVYNNNNNDRLLSVPSPLYFLYIYCFISCCFFYIVI